MRNRFFVIILLTLILSAFAINSTYSEFFKQQRLKLIDERINESVNLVLSSEKIINSFSKHDSALIERTLSEVLKGKRIGRGFILRDRQSNIVFESFNVSLLNTEITSSTEWVTAETDTEYIRFKNTKVPELKDYTLQVGLILDRNFLSWEIIDQTLVLYIIGIVISLFLTSAILTIILLSPMRLLSKFLTETSSKISGAQKISSIPNYLISYRKGFWARADELTNLLNSLEKLISKINSNHILIRASSMQMAHELKTPLAILRSMVESQRKSNSLSEPLCENIIRETNQMNEIINRFLEWAEVENSIAQKDIHSIDLYQTVQKVANRVNGIFPNRLHISTIENFSVFASPTYLEQVIVNLLTNALKYSKTDLIVRVEISKPFIRVFDQGTGIPKDVLSRLGEPFNVGSNQNNIKTGHGLGLAMIATVVKLYNWNLLIDSGKFGTRITIEFPENSIA